MTHARKADTRHPEAPPRRLTIEKYVEIVERIFEEKDFTPELKKPNRRANP